MGFIIYLNVVSIPFIVSVIKESSLSGPLWYKYSTFFCEAKY